MFDQGELVLVSAILGGAGLNSLALWLVTSRGRRRRRTFADVEYQRELLKVKKSQRELSLMDSAAMGSSSALKVLQVLKPGKAQFQESLGDQLVRQAVMGEGLFARKNTLEEMREMREMWKEFGPDQMSARDQMIIKGLEAVAPIGLAFLKATPGLAHQAAAAETAMVQAQVQIT